MTRIRVTAQIPLDPAQAEATQLYDQLVAEFPIECIDMEIVEDDD